MNRTLITVTLATLVVATTATTATADQGCTTGTYQGAPVDICPAPIPDPTNCYTGWYQGAPIEVCMPTGATLPEGSTMNGLPVVIHHSTTIIEVAAVVETPVDAPVAEPAPAPAVTVRTYFHK